jgi:hypothetical protein
MSALTEFFLSSSPAVRQLDLLEITHPNFTQDYRIVRNAYQRLTELVPGTPRFGVTVDHESGGGTFEYEYCPMSVKPMGAGADLTQQLSVTLGDLGTIITKEIAAVTLANKMDVRPTLKFRCYRSDDLSEPILGPVTLELKDVTRSAQGTSFNAIAPLLNVSRTGVLYTVEQFPMLRGFLN